MDIYSKISDLTDFIEISFDEENNIISIEIYELDYDYPKTIDLAPIASSLQKLESLNIEVYEKVPFNSEILFELPKLEYLRLEIDTELNDLDFVKNMPNLKSIYIENSNIHDLQPLHQCKSLEEISILSAEIDDISPLKDLQELTLLNFSFNQIESIEVMKSLQKLVYVSFVNNKIQDITPISKCNELKSLLLSQNKIESVDVLKNCIHLENLILSENAISDSSFVKKLPRLKRLHIGKNQLKNIDAISYGFNLEDLDVSYNQINNIQSFSNLKKLRIINASFNKIFDIQPLIGLLKVKRLVLSGNTQLSMDKGFKFTSQLDSFFLDNCNLSDIDCLSNQKLLRYISLNENQISDVESLNGNFLLNEINLRHNQISEAFPAYYFPNLNSVDLTGNKFGNKIYKSIIPNGKTIDNELYKDIADYYYDKNDLDAALAFYYLRNNPNNRSFDIYIKKFLQTPVNQLIYLKLYLSKILLRKGIITPEIADKILTKISEIKDTNLNRKWSEIIIQSTRAKKTLLWFNQIEFFYYEKTKNPVLKDEYYISKFRLDKKHIASDIYYLKKLYDRKSPFFYHFRLQILLILRNHFAYTKEERIIHDKYYNQIIEIQNQHYDVAPKIDTVYIIMESLRRKDFIYYDEKLYDDILKSVTREEYNTLMNKVDRYKEFREKHGKKKSDNQVLEKEEIDKPTMLNKIILMVIIYTVLILIALGLYFLIYQFQI